MDFVLLAKLYTLLKFHIFLICFLRLLSQGLHQFLIYLHLYLFKFLCKYINIPLSLMLDIVIVAFLFNPYVIKFAFQDLISKVNIFISVFKIKYFALAAISFIIFVSF